MCRLRTASCIRQGPDPFAFSHFFLSPHQACRLVAAFCVDDGCKLRAAEAGALASAAAAVQLHSEAVGVLSQAFAALEGVISVDEEKARRVVIKPPTHSLSTVGSHTCRVSSPYPRNPTRN